MDNLYLYRCPYCEVEEQIVAAMFEDEATCVQCGELMFRLDDPFVPNQKSEIVVPQWEAKP